MSGHAVGKLGDDGVTGRVGAIGRIGGRHEGKHWNSSSGASHLISFVEDLITFNSLLISFDYFAAIK